jgi:membrane associated rhomboid family serine protease
VVNGRGLTREAWRSAVFFAVLTWGAQWLSDTYGGWVFVRSDYLRGAWWQLLTAQCVHFGYLHAVVNAAAMLVVLLVYETWVAGRVQCVALLGGYSGVAVALALDPHCTAYAGASGALHGLFAGCALGLFFSTHATVAGLRRHHRRVASVLLLAGLGVKLLVQHLSATASEPGWLGFATYYPAHEAGALGGCLAVLLLRGFWGQVFASPGAHQHQE